MLLTAGRLSRALQLTLAIIKPDAVAHPLMLQIYSFTVKRNREGFSEKEDMKFQQQFAQRHMGDSSLDLAIHQTVLEHNFIIVRCKDLAWRRADSERFYAEHSGRFFYQRLIEFMSSGPIRAYILAREDAIQQWRALMGPTKVFRARYECPASVRAQFGLTDTRNTTHGSDSVESAHREIGFFFPEFSVADWMEKEEASFRRGPIHYNQEKQIHTLSTPS